MFRNRRGFVALSPVGLLGSEDAVGHHLRVPVRGFSPRRVPERHERRPQRVGACGGIVAEIVAERAAATALRLRRVDRAIFAAVGIVEAAVVARSGEAMAYRSPRDTLHPGPRNCCCRGFGCRCAISSAPASPHPGSGRCRRSSPSGSSPSYCSSMRAIRSTM